MLAFLKDIFRPLYYISSSRTYRTYQYLLARHGGAKRYQSAPVSFDGHKFEVPDVKSFVNQFREIFFEEIYKFRAPSNDLLIVDCGANVGLSCLYFSQNYPQSRIIAFEADPNIFGFLSRNISASKLGNVELHNKAVWIHSNGVSFQQDGADGGSVVSNETSRVVIPSVSLKDFLQDKKVDFLKMDIEGAEADVLTHCGETLRNVKSMFFEFHSYRGQEQKLDVILKTVSDQGFRYYIQSPHPLYSPLVNLLVDKQPLDLQLNVFCYRQ